jgi:TPR repeat protein
MVAQSTFPSDRTRGQVEPIATTAAAAVAAYASQLGAGARGEPEPVVRPRTAMRLASLLGELASRDQETGAAFTLVIADPADPARLDVLTGVLAARAEADPVLAEGLREMVHGVEEDEEIRLSLERDLQFAAYQRLVALAVDLGMARAEFEAGPSATGGDTDRQAPSTAPLQEAEQWFRSAADAGSPRAQFDLGFLLAERGEVAEAEQWLRKAAAAGDTGVASRAIQALERIRANRRRSPGS